MTPPKDGKCQDCAGTAPDKTEAAERDYENKRQVNAMIKGEKQTLPLKELQRPTEDDTDTPKPTKKTKRKSKGTDDGASG